MQSSFWGHVHDVDAGPVRLACSILTLEKTLSFAFIHRLGELASCGQGVSILSSSALYKELLRSADLLTLSVFIIPLTDGQH